MSDDKNKKGSFQIARCIFDGELWNSKPSSWLKIWIYILGKVSYKTEGILKRGEGFFQWKKECNLVGYGITTDMIKSFCQYARASTKGTPMIDTRRTTRGVYIKVLNYNAYQTFDNYQNTAPTTKKPLRNHPDITRSKECKESIVADATEESLKNYNFLEELEKLKNGKRKVGKVISLYWKSKSWVFENKQQQDSAFKRELRPATSLLGYSGEQILRSINYCKVNYEVWTLETVLKRIQDLINIKHD